MSRSFDKEQKTVSIVHDYLIQMGGAEQVVAAFHRAYPTAPIYTSVVNRNNLMKELRSANIHQTWMGLIPKIRQRFKAFFLLYPLAFRMLRPLGTDITLISSSGFAHSVRTTKGAIKVCYCHTPPRFIWASRDYLQFEKFSALQKAVLGRLLDGLKWGDYRAAQQVDYFVANSECVKRRIKETYDRESVVIYPPVRLSEMVPTQENDGYYLIASRLVSYKRLDTAVEAFKNSGRRLIIVGAGPDRDRLQKLAGPNVEFKGWLPRDKMLEYMRRCYALLFPGYEDFGITPVEAQACGKPVLAYGAGGALETILPGKTGLFFNEQTAQSIAEKLPDFEAIDWDFRLIAEHAAGFSEDRFIQQISEFVNSAASKATAQ